MPRKEARVLPLLLALAAIGCNRDAAQLPAGDGERGRALFVEMECAGCHRVAGDDRLPAPTVHPPVQTTIGGPVTVLPYRGALATAIAMPSRDLAPFEQAPAGPDGRSRMPDYAHRLTVQQLADLTAFVESRYWRVPPQRF